MTLIKETAMDVGAEEVTIIGAIVGWAGTTFGFGRAYGALKSRVETTEGDIADLHESVERVLRCFVTADGEPRLVSYAALDKIREPCRAGIAQRIEEHEKLIEKHDKKLDKILDGIAALNGKNGNGK